jgi:hypothetical protein
MLSSGQKLTLDLLATITLEVVPFHVSCDFVSIISLCQNGGFSVLSSIGETEKFGGGSPVILSQKFPGQRGNVRQCIVMMQQAVFLSPKFGGEVFAHFDRRRK